MSGESYITGSAITPIFHLLNDSILSENAKDKPLTNELHKAILADLELRNTSPEVVHLLEVCSFVDPRFKLKYSQTSKERTLWDSGLCPLFRGCPLLGGCLK